MMSQKLFLFAKMAETHGGIPVYLELKLITCHMTIVCLLETNQPQPGCSKLAMLLVNETLNFQMLTMQKCGHFLAEKM